MKTFLRNIKNKIVIKIYSLFFSSLDRNYFLLIEILYKKIGRKESQYLFERLHRLSLHGMNYGNSFPDENGEYNLIRTLSNSIENNDQKIIFDVGANIGDYTIKLRENLSNPRIYCFEPSKSTFNDLKNNTNGLKDIIYINKGLGESEKEITLYKNSKISALASIYNRNLNHLDITFDEKEIIEITTLDKYCADNEIHNIDYLKLDVEGNELNAFIGAKNMLSNKKIKHIQFEMGGCNIDSKTSWHELFNILKPNYNIYRILKNGVHEFLEYSEYDEIFVYANYYARAKD